LDQPSKRNANRMMSCAVPGTPQGEPEINDADADNLDMPGDIDYGFAAAPRRGIESPRSLA
jgi:hypothetical protein